MLGAKADYYEKQCDDLTLSRILKAVGPISNPIPNPNPIPNLNPNPNLTATATATPSPNP